MTTRCGVGFSSATLPSEAGREAATSALGAIGTDGPADIALVFASCNYDFGALLHALRGAFGATPVVGCSAAGEFTGAGIGQHGVAVMVIRSDSIRFRIGVGKGLKASQKDAVAQALKAFPSEHRAARAGGFSHANCIVLADGLAGRGEDLVEAVHAHTGMLAQVVGGAAADAAKFERTDIFVGTEHHSDALVVLYAFSKSPIGIGVRHGLVSGCDSMIVTRSSENVVYEIDGRPAKLAYDKFAQSIGYPLTDDNRDAFMITHEIGVLTPTGEYKIRAPLRSNPDGSIAMASEVPAGASVTIMRGTKDGLVEASEKAARSALAGVGEALPAGIIVFDCICRRIFLGEQYRDQVEAIAKVVGGSVPLIGWETYGEIAMTVGQQSGWHNSTTVVAILPA